MADDTPVKKKSRLRASDIKVTGQWNISYEQEYDFSRITGLKGKRNASIQGRPPNVIETWSRRKPSDRIEHQVHSVVECENSIPVVEPVEVFPTCALNTDELYRDALIRHGGFHSLSDNKTFVALDFSTELSILKVNKYVFLKRIAYNFHGEWRWVYTCSCNPSRSELIDCLSVNVDITFEDFTLQNPGCIHSGAVEILLEEFDISHCIIPDISGSALDDRTEGINEENGFDQNIVALGTDHYYVISKQGPGVVEQSGKCLTCNCCNVACPHLILFNEIHNPTEVCTQKSDGYRPHCYSSEKIPFHSNADLQEVYQVPALQRSELVRDNFVDLASSMLYCAKCNTDIIEQPVVQRCVFLVMVSGTTEIQVSVKQCPNCKHVTGIDGLDVGFINLGHYLVCHEILRRYMYYFFSGRSTLYTEFQVLKEYMTDHGDRHFSQNLSYAKFKWAWYSFIELLDIAFDEGFFCPDCGDNPDSLIMDATSVSFRKELASWSLLGPAGESRPPKPPSAKEKRLRRDERSMLPLSVREPLSAIISKGGMKADMKSTIMSAILQECPSYVELLKVILDSAEVKADCLFLNHPWNKFVGCLVSPYPACSLLSSDPRVHSVLRSISPEIRGNMQELAILQYNIPTLFALIQDLKDDFPFDCFKNAVEEMISRSTSPFGRCHEVIENIRFDTENISYFPTLEVVRGRGLYSSDKDITRARECTKMSRGHPSLLPGIFTLFCNHGVCYGFEVMKYHESPNVPFTILRSRCKEAPSLVVYDNACNLHQYCINRDPDFFKNTAFRVDALHFKNHKACGSSYELKAYPQHKKLNSQVVEQANSRIQRIKSQLSYMTQSNFVNHCKLFLWAQNKKVIQPRN